MEVLIKDQQYVKFLIEFKPDQDFETSIMFTVHEVTSWSVDNTYSDYKKYLEGYIKWDGCSHINFGDDDGYLHLCGRSYFESHKAVMDAVWKVASTRIKKFDEEGAE